MYKTDDTIAAVATALGHGGVGIIRISGPNAAEILSKVVSVSPSSLKTRYLHYGHAELEDEVIDEVLYVIMRAPHSFTGEDVAEIHGHGGAANLGRLLKAVIQSGARLAEAGEFTRRAFVNERIDLTRAEAIADIVNASSEKALREAQKQLRGSLGDIVDLLITETTSLLAEIEAGIDFPEDVITTTVKSRRAHIGNELSARAEKLASSFGQGKLLKDGIDVVLRGPVNVGKSSLFNTLVGQNRAIVDSSAGTTRDYVETEVVWSGMQITLVDTAGIRDAESQVEDMGIVLGEKRASEADIELLVYPVGHLGEIPVPTSKQILVRSKRDLLQEREKVEGISTSAKSGFGIEELKSEILTIATSGESEAAEGCIVTNERQRSRLEKASNALCVASNLIEQAAPPEVIVIELNTARQNLKEITGVGVDDGVLDELFSRFCIGK